MKSQLIKIKIPSPLLITGSCDVDPVENWSTLRFSTVQVYNPAELRRFNQHHSGYDFHFPLNTGRYSRIWEWGRRPSGSVSVESIGLNLPTNQRRKLPKKPTHITLYHIVDQNLSSFSCKN